MQETIVGGSGGCRVRQSGRTDDARVINATDASALPKTTLQVLLGTPTKKKSRCQKTSALKMAATYSPTICSTIGVAELNDPVRNGKGWDLSAITT